MLKRTQVFLTKDFMLWNMDCVWKVLNGLLWSLGNLQHAFRTKFISQLFRSLVGLLGFEMTPVVAMPCS